MFTYLKNVGICLLAYLLLLQARYVIFWGQVIQEKIFNESSLVEDPENNFTYDSVRSHNRVSGAYDSVRGRLQFYAV